MEEASTADLSKQSTRQDQQGEHTEPRLGFIGSGSLRMLLACGGFGVLWKTRNPRASMHMQWDDHAHPVHMHPESVDPKTLLNPYMPCSPFTNSCTTEPCRTNRIFTQSLTQNQTLNRKTQITKEACETTPRPRLPSAAFQSQSIGTSRVCPAWSVAFAS